MLEFIITPTVDTTQEFIEIANDFTNPLDVVREAISNSFDAGASRMEMSFNTVQEYGNRVLVIRLNDNGAGMSRAELQAFFDLGNSPKRGNRKTIGEKGHGTKVFFNSSEIQVETVKDNTLLSARMVNPYQLLFDRQIPQVQVTESNVQKPSGTEIVIKGYNRNQSARFTHAEIKDYILWFTKFGSFEKEFGINADQQIILALKGLDQNEKEEIQFGHVFPNESGNTDRLFDTHNVSAPDYYCKKITKNGRLRNYPDIEYHVIFFIEGNRVKQEYNTMIRRQGRPRISGDYTVQERYGLWLCKDFIPIQRKNEWITSKGSEYTKFHAFINCQSLRLTANRGSVENTPSELLEDIKSVAVEIYGDILGSDDWLNLSWLEEEAEGYMSTQIEQKNFNMRTDRANRAQIAKYRNTVQDTEIELVEPSRENGVFALVIQLLLFKPELFPFTIVDYDTHQGIDVLVKSRSQNPIHQTRLFYVEFKHIISTQSYNHSFENTHSIVCWDIKLRHDDILKDINGRERKLEIIPPQGADDYTRYFLNDQRSERKIEIFVLKPYLNEKLGINFSPRTANETVQRA